MTCLVVHVSLDEVLKLVVDYEYSAAFNLIVRLLQSLYQNQDAVDQFLRSHHPVDSKSQVEQFLHVCSNSNCIKLTN